MTANTIIKFSWELYVSQDGEQAVNNHVSVYYGGLEYIAMDTVLCCFDIHFCVSQQDCHAKLTRTLKLALPHFQRLLWNFRYTVHV